MMHDLAQGMQCRQALISMAVLNGCWWWQVVATKELAEDEALRLRQLLEEAAGGGQGSTSQHLLRGYEQRLVAAQQHLVQQACPRMCHHPMADSRIRNCIC